MPEVIYNIERPATPGTIEVYGEAAVDFAWYEWRIIEHGLPIRDSGTMDGDGLQYGSPGIALRDALVHDTGAGAVVPIRWTGDDDSLTENLAQLHHAIQTLADMADALEHESADAKAMRRFLNPDHANGRRGMIYTDARTASTDRLAEALRGMIHRLERMTDDESR